MLFYFSFNSNGLFALLLQLQYMQDKTNWKLYCQGCGYGQGQEKENFKSVREFWGGGVVVNLLVYLILGCNTELFK